MLGPHLEPFLMLICLDPRACSLTPLQLFSVSLSPIIRSEMPVRAISLKAIVIANILNVLLLGVFPLCLGAAGVLLAAQVTDIHSALQRLDQSVVFTLVALGLSLTLAAYIAGYAAGRIAQKGELLNGALSSAAIILFGIADAAFGPFSGPEKVHIPPLVDFILSYSGPLFGILGGYVARRKRHTASSSSVGSAPGSAGKRVILVIRWILAVPAAVVAYYLVLLPTVAIFGKSDLVALVFAVVAGIGSGTAAAPPQHRKLAGVVFIGLAILVPILKTAVDFAVGGPTDIDTFLIVINIIGAGLSYSIFPQIFPNDFTAGPGKWWWLSVYPFNGYTAIERRVRRRIWLVSFGALAPLFAMFLLLGRRIGVDDHYTSPIGGLIALIIAIAIARPISTRLWPEQVRQADEDASARLGGVPQEPFLTP